jgi:hypothetical protein
MQWRVNALLLPLQVWIRLLSQQQAIWGAREGRESGEGNLSYRPPSNVRITNTASAGISGVEQRAS